MKLILILYITLFSITTYAQCPGFPVTTADEDCGIYTSLSNSTTIGPGDTFGICNSSSSSTSFSSISLSGGTMRICGNTTITGSFNSGTVVVACGATLNLPSGLTLNQNMGIINYGTVNVTGDLTYQNNNCFFYNESTTSRLYISGSVTYPQNNGQNAYLKNNGYISIGNNFNARDGGFTCLGPDSRLICNNINYIGNCGGPSDRFSYAGTSNNPIIQYQNSATIKANFTASSFIDVYSVTGANLINNGGCGGGSWGSANLTTNTSVIANPSAPDPSACATPNCFTTLPITLTKFTAEVRNNRIQLDWTTSSEINNDFFTIEKSLNAINWEKFEKIDGAGNSSSLVNYNTLDKNPYAGVSYYRLKQTDFDGQFEYSQIRSVNIDKTSNTSIFIYPNPTKDEITIEGNDLEFSELKISNLLGQDLTQLTVLKNNNRQNLVVDLSRLDNGIYFVSINSKTVKVYRN